MEWKRLWWKWEYYIWINKGKGLVREYSSSGNLISENEYLNGEENGKGKEYKYNKLSFEGEYYNGKKWNGKEYEQKGNVIYELKNGKGLVR